MFGLGEALLSFMRRQVGLRTDTASSTGSLHAKVKDAKNNIISEANSIKSTLQRPRGVHGIPGSFSTTQTEYQTALSVTGKGKLTHLAMATTSANTGYVKITIDGAVIAYGSVIETGGKRHYPTSDLPFTTTEMTTPPNFDADGSPKNAEFSYKASLKIELKSHNQGHNIIAYWQYEHE